MQVRWLPVVAVCVSVFSFAAVAEHEVREGDYFTAVFMGDNFIICGVDVDATVEGETGVNPGTGIVVDIQDETGWCLGGQSFAGLDAGRWEISIEDDHAGFVSGAYRVEDAAGEVQEDNVDECFDAPITTNAVPNGGTIAVWVDGVLWWAIGQPCGEGQTSQGTFGTITIEHLTRD